MKLILQIMRCYVIDSYRDRTSNEERRNSSRCTMIANEQFNDRVSTG